MRDTAITRLALAKLTTPQIAAISGHSLKTIEHILGSHDLVASEEAAMRVGEEIEAWRLRTDIV